MMKNNNVKKITFPIFIIIVLVVAFVIEMIIVSSNLLVDYDQQHFYPDSISYHVRSKDYPSIMDYYYDYKYKDVRKTSEYKAQESIGEYYAASMLLHAYEHVNNEYKVDYYNSRLKDIKVSMSDYAILADDIDDAVESRIR